MIPQRKITFQTLQAMDPTHTITLRRQFTADVNKRHRALKGVINASIIDNDCFGLKEPRVRRLTLAVLAELVPIPPKTFQFERDSGKVEGFMAWLNEMESRGTLEVTELPGLPPGPEPWSNIHIRSSYQSGLAKARSDLIKAGVDVPNFLRGAEGVSLSFNQPFHADKVGLIYTRVFEQLKGVDAVMDAQISRLLALGLAEGDGVSAIAKSINDRVDKIGITRSRLIARTEVVQTSNIAATNEYEAAEDIVGEEIFVLWQTAQDEVVRDTHADRNQRIYTRKRARQLIGEPNCRCALLPYIPSSEGVEVGRSAKSTAGKSGIRTSKSTKDGRIVPRGSEGAPPPGPRRPAPPPPRRGTRADRVLEPTPTPEPTRRRTAPVPISDIDPTKDRTRSQWIPVDSKADANVQFKNKFNIESVATVGFQSKPGASLKIVNAYGQALADEVKETPSLGKVLNKGKPVKKITLHRRGDLGAVGQGLRNADGTYNVRRKEIHVAGANKILNKNYRRVKLTSGKTFVVSNGDPTGTMMHELGHHAKLEALTRQQRVDWIDNVYPQNKHLSKKISTYAQETPNEFWAEAFAKYSHPEYSQLASNSPKRIPKGVENFMKEVFED